MKTRKVMPKGTFVDLETIDLGQQAILICPNGKMIRTSAIENYFVSSSYWEIVTQNSIYCSK